LHRAALHATTKSGCRQLSGKERENDRPREAAASRELKP
jgi:hypothetical protein